MNIINKRIEYKYIIIMPILILLGIIFFDYILNASIYLKTYKIKNGMIKNDVYNIMGEPYKVLTKGQNFVEGYQKPKKAINNKALVFYGGDKIAYIYLNNNEKVEYVFVGGS